MLNISRVKKIDYFSLVVSLLGLVVSVAALFVAKQANKISETVARKSTDPFLIYEVIQIPSANLESHQFELRVHNVGLGPAVILGFEAYKNEQLVSGRSPVNGHELAASFGFGEQVTSRDDLQYGQVIPSNGMVTIFKITAWHKPITLEKFAQLVRVGEFEHYLVICYRSMYPDRYFATVDPKRKLPKSSCAAPGFFTNFSALPDPMRIELKAPVEISP